MGSQDALPDAILELVLLGLDSPLCLLREASTCKRWRRIIASDAFRALHGAPHAVAGSYYNEGISVRPRFDPSLATAAAAVDVRHFSLDFVPGDDESSWTVVDSRGSLLLLDREDCRTGHCDLIVCEPLTRRHVMIPPPTPAVAYNATSVLLDGDGDGDGDEHGGCIGMSNFRVLCLSQVGSIRACMFSSGRSYWRETCTDERPALHLQRIGVAAGRRFWHERKKKVVALDQNTLEFSCFVLPDPDDDIVNATLAVGRDGEPRIVVDGTGGKLKIFARLQGGGGGGSGGEEWALEKTIQVSAGMLGEPRLRRFNSIWHLPLEAGMVQIQMAAPGRAKIFRLDMETVEVERLLGREREIMDCVSEFRKAHPLQFPWPPSLRACCTDDDDAL